MSPHRRLGVPRLFELSRRGKALGATLVLLVLLFDGLPTGGGIPSVSPSAVSHASAPTATLTAQAEALLPHAGSPVSAAPHPAVSSGPRWTDLQSKVTNQVPAYRYLASMAYDAVDHYVLLFGGFGNGSGTPYADTWTYADGHWTNLAASGPGARYAAFMTWDPVDQYVVLFGGYDSSTGSTLNDTWAFVGGSWSQLNPTVSPAARWRGGMAFDIADGYAVLFGGTPSGLTNSPEHDTWKFVGGSWTNITTNVTGSTTMRFRQEMTYDVADKEIVMFGGCTSSGCNPASQDTVVYSNLTWTLLTLTTKPSARAYEGITYDAAQGYVLMFAGDNYGTGIATADTWEFQAGNWTDLTSTLTTSPSTRAFEMLAYDAYDGYTLLFGGQNPSGALFMNDTWAFGPSVIGHFVAAPSVVDLGQSIRFNATPFAYSGYTNFTYVGLPPGCTGGNFSTLTCTPNATGTFNVSVEINDSSGVPTEKNVTAAVNPDLAVTGIFALPATVTVGTRLHINVSAINGTAPYSYAYTGLPTGCSSGNTASLGCTPTGAGSFTVQATVTDSVGGSSATRVNVSVNPSPSLGALVALPSTIDLGEHLTLWANATGGTAPLTYTYTQLPAGCSSVNGPMLTCTPTATGPATIHVNVTDSFGWTVTATAAITINTDPSVTGLAVAPAAIDLGQSVTFWMNVTGGTGALSRSYSGMPAGCNIGRAATGTCTPTTNGTFVIFGNVTDARGLIASQSITLTVTADPAVTSVTVSPSHVDVGQTVVITVEVSGGTAPISYTFSGLPAASCANATTAIVTCHPRAAGQYSIVAQISDAWHMSSQLAASLSVNALPAISAFTATVSPVTVGSATVLQVSVTGGSGVFRYAYTGLPTGCASANLSSITCTPSVTGTFNVTVTVTDSLGSSVTSSTSFVVSAAPSSSTFLGFSGSTGYLVIAALVVVIVAVLAAVMMMRRRRPPAEPAAEWAEAPPEGSEPPQ